MQNSTDALSVKQNMLWNTIGCLIYQGCLWAITILVVTLSGYTNSGYLAFAMAMGNIFFPLATYNVRTYQVSDIKSEFSSGNYIAFRIITIAIALVVVIAYVLFSTPSSELIFATLAWMIFKSDEAFCNVYYGVDQKRGRMDFIGISQGVRGVCVIASFSLFLYFTQNINAAIVAMSISCICVTFFYDRRKALSLSDARISITREMVLGLFKACLPSMLTLLCYGAAPSIARQIYEGLDGTYLLGIYAAIATPTVLMQVAASYLYSPFIEPLSKARFNSNQSYVKSTILKIVLAIAGICAILFVASYFWGTDLLVLVFGKGIKQHGYVLPYTVLVAASIAAMGFFIEIMVIYRHLVIAFAANLSALAITAATAWFFIGAFGMNGVNYALTLAFILAITIGTIAFGVKEKVLK